MRSRIRQQMKTLERLQSRIEVFEENGAKIARKIATDAGSQEILDQIALFKNLPPGIAEHYPTLLDWQTHRRPFSYVMPWYDLPTLQELVLESARPPAEIASALSSVVKFLFGVQFRWKEGSVPRDYVQRIYIDRVFRRLPGIFQSGVLHAVISAETVIFQDRELQNPIRLLSSILAKQPLMEALLPPRLGFVHGQIELAHILIDTSGPANFILLDARGPDALLDAAYDLGKLRQGTRSYLDWLERDLFSLQWHLEGSRLVIDTMELDVPDRLQVCQQVDDALNTMVSPVSAELKDAHLLMRSDFAEATHLCSGLGFLFHGRHSERAVAGFLQAALSLSAFVDKYL